MRIGEVLVGRKLIEPSQLRKALDAQLIYGGHLGTCLIELGFLDDDTLGRALAAVHGVAYAPRELVLEPEREALGAVPVPMVEKHAVVPFHLEDRTIHLAMIEPTDLTRLDEVAFAAGQPVRAFVSPEIVIRHAMERFYDIPRATRYIAMAPALSAAGARREVAPRPEIRQEVVAAIDRLAPEIAAQPSAVPAPPEIEGGGAISFGRKNLTVSWVKRVTDAAEGDSAKWCNLFDLPLEHPHFDDLEGVYVVWHQGVDPVLRVGQGAIRSGLRALLQDSRVCCEHESNGLFVTWADVRFEHRGGVAGYLTRMLQPRQGTESATTPAIEVNLPQ